MTRFRTKATKERLRSRSIIVVIVAAIYALSASIAFAHESRRVGEYELLAGWMQEPAYEGLKNGVDFRVTRADEHSHDDGHGHGHGDAAAAIEGLEDTVEVEVTHEPSGTSKVFALRGLWGQPGRYTADVIPTRPGAYEFRFFGRIEGMEIDEAFGSASLGGGFDDVVSSGGIHFPERLAEAREIESAVRGALSTAESAAASAAAAEQRLAGVNTLAIIALVIALVSAVGTALLALRKR